MRCVEAGAGRGERCVNLCSGVSIVAHAKKWTIPMVIIISQRGADAIGVAAEIAECL